MKYSVFLICFLMGLNALAQERFIKIDSCKLWVNTIGIENRKVDQPIIVFESGHGTPMGNWDRVLEGAAELAPVIVYDRPGIGKSSPIDEEPTMKNVADRLVRMFNHLELEPPYLLVGHSLGGMYVRGFAIYYPDLLAGRHNTRAYFDGFL